jgi:hypothetical protein
MTQVLAHLDQPNTWRNANPSASRLAWGSLQIFCSAINRALLALVNFWNIPTLGEDETRESRYFRTKHYV